MNLKSLACPLSILLILFAASCGVPENGVILTSTSAPITSTVPASLTPAPSETPLPPPPQPTAVTVEGTASTQINVRAEPSTSGNVLGILPANTKVQIVGKDPGGNWWQILYEPGTDGKGWLTAQYVTVADASAVPVIGGDPADPANGNVAIVQQQINVRSGPGTSFNALGTLNAQDVVTLIGKDANGAWLQIAYPAGPDGKGWLNAAFVQAHGVENLPIVSDAGQVLGTGTPISVPATPTATVLPAWADGDSQSNPVVNVIFDPLGTRTLIYRGDVSTPQGDAEDWVNFKPSGTAVNIRLTCAGNGSLQVEILENGNPLQQISCQPGIQQIVVNPNSVYSVHLQIEEAVETLQVVGYTISIEND